MIQWPKKPTPPLIGQLKYYKNMTAVWTQIENLSRGIEKLYQETGEQYSEGEHEYAWYNSLYQGQRYRRAHIEIVDRRESHKIYILHATIFPHFHDPSPIWGFDAVCGPNKITGAFHDFSSAGDSTHQMIQWFTDQTSALSWNKPRELPSWARAIFSPGMIAAGNIQKGAELDSLCEFAIKSLDYYLTNVGATGHSGDYHMAQNRYCYYQKQNPHVVNSMVAMGVPREQMVKFVDEILFPELV